MILWTKKIFGRDEKALTTLKLLNCMWHFVTDDIPRHPFNACTNFYLFNKCDCSEILKLEIISSSFHQQQETELGVQDQLLVPSSWDFPLQAADWGSPPWRGNEITSLHSLRRNLAEGATWRSTEVTWSTLWASVLQRCMWDGFDYTLKLSVNVKPDLNWATARSVAPNT